MVIAGLLLAFAVTLWVYYLWSRMRYYKFALKIPGPLGLPFIGVAHKLLNIADILYELPKYTEEKKTKTCSSWLGPYLILYTRDPKIVEVILHSPDSIDKSIVYDVIGEALGNGIVTSKTPTWNKHRKLINPCFNHKVLLSFFPHFNKFTRELCAKMDAHVDCGEVNVMEFLFDMSLKISVASTMGVDFDHQSNNKILKSMERLLNLTTKRVMRPWLRSTAILRATSLYKPFMESRSITLKFVQNLLKDKLKVLDQQNLDQNNNPPDPAEELVDIAKTNHIFIEHAIKVHQRNEFTFDDVVTEANVMVFAAYETTASTLYSALIFLAMHPQFQERAYDEIVSVFPEKEFDVNYENLKDLVYLDMCINETLRVANSIPLIARNCINDVAISEDLVIPKGTQVIIDIFNMHRDKDVWGPGASTYNPDHFLPSNLVGMHKYSFIPFSKGIRNCIGWQYAGFFLRVALVQILRKYKFSTKFRFEDLKFMEHITLRYEVSPQLEIQRR